MAFLGRPKLRIDFGLQLGVAAVALLVSLLFFIASYASLGRGGEIRIPEAFAHGALIDSLQGDHFIGRHQFNDCLILALAMEQNEPRDRLAISPVNPFSPSEQVCADLRKDFQSPSKVFYHNYLHGHTVLVRYLLPHLSVHSIRELYKAISSLLLLLGMALCFARLAQLERQRDAVVILIALFGLSRFFGLEWFGQSLGHGPADMVLIGFVALIAARLASFSAVTWAHFAGLFGALTMIFEFLTGGLPMGAALVIGLGWFALQPADRNVGSVANGLIAFTIGAGTLLLVKLALVGAVFGLDALADVARAGTSRMNGPLPQEYGAFVAWEQLVGNIGVLAPGLPTFATGLLTLAITFGFRAAVRSPEPASLLLLSSCLPIILWFLLFQQHTAIHAWFMARILVWPASAGFALVALSAMRVKADASEASSPGTESIRLVCR